MGIDPAAVLAVISEQATRIAALSAENAQLRQELARAMSQDEGLPHDG